jgi:hypothetical protein
MAPKTLLNPLRSASRDRLHVINQTIQPPLRAHLASASEREPVQPLVVPEIGEDGLHRADASAVERAAFG